MVPITSSVLSWASLLGEKNDVGPREEIKMTKTFLVCKKLVTKWATSVQFNSVSQSCLTPCHPMNRSTPGLPVYHQLWEFTQTHVWAGDAIKPSHPLLFPSPPTFNLSQPQGLFQWVSSSHGAPKFEVLASVPVLPMNIQDWFPLRCTGWISLQSKGLAGVFSNTTVQKHQFFGAQLSL